jgi:hypothetical protein
MSETKTTDNRTQLTIKPTHFPKIILATAATCWGLSVLGAVLEMVAH